MYKVVVLNDDYTPMEFVVMILEDIFKRSKPDAIEIMLMVHQAGKGVAGIYTREVSETKAAQVHTLAKNEGHPLRCTIEAE